MSAVVLLALIQARIKQNLDDLKERMQNLEELQNESTKNDKTISESCKQRATKFRKKDINFLKSTMKYTTMIIWMRKFNKPS